MKPVRWLIANEAVLTSGAMLAALTVVFTAVQEGGFTFNVLLGAIPLAVSAYARSQVSSQATVAKTTPPSTFMVTPPTPTATPHVLTVLPPNPPAQAPPEDPVKEKTPDV